MNNNANAKRQQKKGKSKNIPLKASKLQTRPKTMKQNEGTNIFIKDPSNQKQIIANGIKCILLSELTECKHKLKASEIKDYKSNKQVMDLSDKLEDEINEIQELES